MTAPVHVLSLPDQLREHHGEIQSALALPLLAGEWPEDETFLEARQPEAIGRVLVEAIHTELSNARIGYLFREDIRKLDKLVLARIGRVSGKLQHFANLDYLIEVNWSAWRRLSSEQRVAVIDHELCHAVKDETPEGERKWSMIGHDVEEFRAIVQRWGLWKIDLRAFGQTVKGTQTDLFEREVPPV